jgi:hypothetical protein
MTEMPKESNIFGEILKQIGNILTWISKSCRITKDLLRNIYQNLRTLKI